MKTKWIIIISLGLIILSVLLFNKNTKNMWVCQDGVWVKQGNPQTEKPTTGCGDQEDNQNIIANDDFEIKVFDGWVKMEKPMPGISLMIINNNETSKDENVNRINFRSYYAVTYILSDKTIDEYYLEYIQEVKDTIGDVTVDNISDGEVNGNIAKFIELKLNQQNIDFKTFIAIVQGNNSDFWIISFNTTENLWKSYDYLIPDLLNSFKIKEN